MESIAVRLLIGIMGAGMVLYLIAQVLKAIHQYRARRYWEARRQHGESGFCLHDPETGNIIRVSKPRKD